MALFKCKMCGGDLELAPDTTVAECEYCGTKQTVPTADNEKKITLFTRANRLRAACEFDKAAGIYESIVADFPEEAEAYWGLILCQYGIEYVDDPATGNKVPTCHRSSFESLMDDPNFEQVMEYSDPMSRRVYRDEAKAIEEIRKRIIEVSGKEEPYDIFICYKETGFDGNRTLDSVLAQDIYDALTEKGYRVFFSRITLEDKLGVEYEPYIFAALNSAKVMLAVGTDYEYYNAVWVKNEWSRYLKLIASGQKKALIPCFKGIDAYDMPKEFARLQAQDLGKVGAMQDLLRGIEKILGGGETKKAEPVKETVIVQQSSNTSSLLQRAFMFLEDGDWSSANEYCEKVLDMDPECAEAYLGKLMAELRVSAQEGLKDCDESFDDYNNYKKAIRFGNDKLKAELAGYIKHINDRNEAARIKAEEERLTQAYNNAKNLMSAANTEYTYKNAAQSFEAIANYKDSAELAKKCYEKAEAARKNAILKRGKSHMIGEFVWRYESALKELESITGWKDADECAETCRKKIEEIRAKEEAERIEAERQAEIKRKEAEAREKRNKKIANITTPIVCVIIAFIIVLNTVIIPNNKYNDAIALMDDGKYEDAISAFEALDGYKDSSVKISDCNTAILDGKYNDAIALMDAGKYAEAIASFEALDGYKDSSVKISDCNTAIKDGKYNDAIALMDDGKYVEAAILFGELGDHKDAREQSYNLWNAIAVRDTLSAGWSHTVGIKSDGIVVTVGDNYYGQRDVSDWKDIIAVSVGRDYTVGLKSDGTVVIVGYNGSGQCDVSNWKDIVSISAGYDYTVGLKSDGTVVAVGDNDDGECNVSGWKDIVSVSAGWSHTVGLKADGTVVAVGDNDYGQCDVSEWKDIVSVSAGSSHTVGLKSDGTVVTVGDNDDGQCNVSEWKDIVSVSAGWSHTVGLKADGTVVAVGDNDDGECNVSGWKDIVAISAGVWHTVGLKSDGTVVAVGDNDDGQCNVSIWRNIKQP